MIRFVSAGCGGEVYFWGLDENFAALWELYMHSVSVCYVTFTKVWEVLCKCGGFWCLHVCL